MALQDQKFEINFQGGIDTKTDNKQVIPGKLLELENGRFTSPKEIQKRFGNSSVANITNGKGLAVYNEELLAFNNPNVYAYSESTDSFQTKYSNFVGVEVSGFRVKSDNQNQVWSDSTYHSGTGIQVFTWMNIPSGISSGTVTSSGFTVVDYETKGILLTSQIVAGPAAPKPVALGNYILIFYYSGTTLYVIPFNPSTPTVVPASVSVSATLPAPSTTPTKFDVCTLGTKAYVAFDNDTSGVSLATVDTSLTVSAVTIVGADSVSAVGVFADSVLSQVWVVYRSSTPSVKYFVVDSSLATVLAPTVVEAISPLGVTGIASNGSGKIYYEVTGTEGYDHYVKVATANNAGTVSTANFVLSLGLKSKPFSVSVGALSTTLIMLVYQGGDDPLYTRSQQTYFVLNENGVVVAKILPNLSGGLNNTQYDMINTLVSSVYSVGNNSYASSVMEAAQFYTNTGRPFYTTGVSCSVLNFNSQQSFINSNGGDNLFSSGGLLWLYDGVSFVEQGFNIYPEAPVLTATNVGTGGIAAGTYLYCIVAEWTDSKGQVHRSAPSLSVSITLASASDVSLAIPTIRITQKTDVLLKVYRTLTLGSVFYRVYVPAGVAIPSEANSTTANSITVVDVNPDSIIEGQGVIYTNGGVVDNISVPAPYYHYIYKDRSIVIPSENRNVFWYSKPIVPLTPAEFSDEFIWNVSPKFGPLTCGIEMDDKHILFKTDGIAYMNGSGPSDTGANNDFTEPVFLAVDTGCTEPRSLVLTPSGVMYKSRKGIYLLDRSLGTRYVGADVEAYNSNTILSAELIPDTTQVRFTLSSNVTLVYDYYITDQNGNGQWSVYNGMSAVDAVIYEEKLTWINSSGSVFQEDQSVFNENGTHVKLKLVSAWIPLAGIQGFQRARELLILGEYKSTHTLTVKIAYDYETDYSQTVTVTPTSTPPYQYQVNLAQQKCEAIKISIEDVAPSAPTTPGEAFSISAISLIIGVKKGLYSMPSTRTFT